MCVCVQYSVCVHGDKETTVCLSDVFEKNHQAVTQTLNLRGETFTVSLNMRHDRKTVEYHSEQLIQPDHHRRTHFYTLCQHDNNDRWNVNKQD